MSFMRSGAGLWLHSSSLIKTCSDRPCRLSSPAVAGCGFYSWQTRRWKLIGSPVSTPSRHTQTSQITSALDDVSVLLKGHYNANGALSVCVWHTHAHRSNTLSQKSLSCSSGSAASLRSFQYQLQQTGSERERPINLHESFLAGRG